MKAGEAHEFLFATVILIMALGGGQGLQKVTCPFHSWAKE